MLNICTIPETMYSATVVGRLYFSESTHEVTLQAQHGYGPKKARKQLHVNLMNITQLMLLWPAWARNKGQLFQCQSVCCTKAVHTGSR